MNTSTLFLLAQTVLIPVFMCLLRFYEVKYRYMPLFIYLLTKEITEVISIICIKIYKTGNEEPYNIMFLLEALFINWQFFKLGAYGKKRNLYFALQILWVVLWAAEITLLGGSIHNWNIYFRVTYCSILIFVAVSLISKLAVTTRFNIYQNTGFILSLIFACWFSYNIVYEFAERMAKTSGSLFRMSNVVTAYFGVVEALLYLGCAWAVYRIPVKKIRSFY
jgi:hypothetical protein